MVFLNGNFINKSEAFVSVMDRGFLFGDSVYEVFPCYSGKILKVELHLKRLQKSLNSINIPNPYGQAEWKVLLDELISYHQKDQFQSIYLQITRGCDTDRKHTYTELKPTVYIQSTPFKPTQKNDLLKGASTLVRDDIRWSQCDIKSASLLANVMYAQEAKISDAEDVILCRDGLITECSSSNIFIVKNNCIITHPKGPHILPGITREIVLNCAQECGVITEERAFSKKELFSADEVWISSSTREVEPITNVDNIAINDDKVGPIWSLIYDCFQLIKNDNP